MKQGIESIALGQQAPEREIILSLWTGDRPLAAASAGGAVDRLGIDLERDSKLARQSRHDDNWFADHRLEDLVAYKALMPGRLFARTGEVATGWPEQADELIQAGASWLMLPNVMDMAQVESAVGHVGTRAGVIPMIESRQALGLLPDLVKSGLCEEVYFGANDLSQSLGLATRFHAMVHPEVLAALALCRHASLPFGIGGAAAPRTQGLPIPADVVLRFLACLGASRLLLGRSFVNDLYASEAGGLGARVMARTRQIRAELLCWPVGGHALEQAVYELASYTNKLG